MRLSREGGGEKKERKKESFLFEEFRKRCGRWG